MTLGLILLNGMALGVALVDLAMVGANYGRLPDRIPIHFGITGEPDAWGPRPMIWLLPVIGLFNWALLAALTVVMPKDRLLLALLNLETVALFAVIVRDQIQVALAVRSRISAGVWILLGVVILTSICYPLLQ